MFQHFITKTGTGKTAVTLCLVSESKERVNKFATLLPYDGSEYRVFAAWAKFIHPL
jgi:hypothetical protein